MFLEVCHLGRQCFACPVFRVIGATPDTQLSGASLGVVCPKHWQRGGPGEECAVFSPPL